MSKEMYWNIIVNPWAGRGLGQRNWPAIKNLLTQAGITFNHTFTEYPGHAIELTQQAIARGERNFIAIGGDGTLHEVINGAMLQSEVPTTEITIGIIPSGSGNDWIKLYDMQGSTEDFIKYITDGQTILQDVARCDYCCDGQTGTRYMINIGGLNFDADTCLEFCRMKSKKGGADGSFYVKSILRAMKHSRLEKCTITVDGEQFHDDETFSIALGIGKFSGGGLQQTPYALPDDGLVDMTVVGNISKFRVLCSMPKLLAGRIFDIKRVTHTQFRNATIESRMPINVEIDGEMLGTTPVTITTIPGAIRMCVPRKSHPTEK
ncbi:MAG: YegS/Rv2252/BmrU family lipid kinase [Bacteroidales bacterium]|nr:YegS/Rv2252/BmrU family lipid kinase [Bacteroidales bacterium]